MISRMADKVAAFFVYNQWILQEDKSLYQLGIDVAISTLLQITVILGAGILVHNIIGSVLFVIVMQSIRSNSGGYHAKTRTGCLLAMIVAYLASRYIPVWVIGHHIEIIYCLGCVLFSNLIFFLWVPIKNDRKVLKEGWRPIARKKSIAHLELWIAMSVGIYFTQSYLAVQVMTILFIISLLIVICKTGRRKHDEEEHSSYNYAEGC